MAAAAPDAGLDRDAGSDRDAGIPEEVLVPGYSTEGEPLTDRRDVPNVDGLPEEEATFVDGLIWVPRIILLPAHVVAEYLVRWPAGQIAAFLEKNHFAARVGLFAIEDVKQGFLPLFSFSTEQADAYGLNFYHNDLVGGRVDFDIGVEGNPTRNLRAQTNFEIALPTEVSTFDLHAGYEQRDDNFFFGVGPQPIDRNEALFEDSRFVTGLGWSVGRDDDPFGARIGARLAEVVVTCSTEFARDACGDDGVFGTSDDRFAVDVESVAPLGRDYTFLRAETSGFWDTRTGYPGPGTGARVQGFGQTGFGFGAEGDDLAVVSYGLELAGFWDILGRYRRTFGIRVRGEAADPLGDELIPVGELVSLGGIEKLRGFRADRFRGRSDVLATVDYRYPVWSYFEGEIFVEVGGVFGPHWEDFRFGELRGSAGIGVRSIEILTRHLSYDLNLAVGTAPFESGFDVEEIRVNFGSNWGF